MHQGPLTPGSTQESRVSSLILVNSPKKSTEGGGGQGGTYPFLITHRGDSAIMNVVQTREFWHQERGLRREWLFEL